MSSTGDPKLDAKIEAALAAAKARLAGVTRPLNNSNLGDKKPKNTNHPISGGKRRKSRTRKSTTRKSRARKSLRKSLRK